MMDEQIQIIRAAWVGERPSFEGDFYSFPEVSVTPKPVQPGVRPSWWEAQPGGPSPGGVFGRRMACSDAAARRDRGAS